MTLFYNRETKKVVSLVSAIHVADAAYYRQVADVLAAHDRALYELVTGATDDAFADALRTLSAVIAELLQLEHQRRALPYDDPPANWVHADLSWEQIERRLKAQRMAMPGPPPREVVEEARAFIERYRRQFPDSGDAARNARLLKALLGRLLAADPGKVFQAVHGKRRWDDAARSFHAAIYFRNRRAIDVLGREMRSQRRTFALFYGAAHMPYFAKQLKKRGFECLGSDWLTAWSSRDAAPVGGGATGR